MSYNMIIIELWKRKKKWKEMEEKKKNNHDLRNRL